MSIENIINKIKSELKSDYSADVVEEFIRMVKGWKDDQGRAELVVCNQNLNGAYQARDEFAELTPSIADLEKTVAESLYSIIRFEVRNFDEQCFDLPDVIKYRRANCLGYSLLFYILGNSIGLSVMDVEVTELNTGELPKEIRHIASVVDMVDGKTVMMDLVPSGFFSKPFIMETEFAKVGNYWELKDKNNPLGIHRRIRILNRNGLFAGIYSMRGDNHSSSAQYSEAVSKCNTAIKLDPKFADAYINRGYAYVKLGEYNKAFSDFTQAIELDPKDTEAYFNRGRAYGDLKQYTEAITEYTKAIELDPKYAGAYCNRGITRLMENRELLDKRLSQAKSDVIQQAKDDLLKAVKLNPSLMENAKKGFNIINLVSSF